MPSSPLVPWGGSPMLSLHRDINRLFDDVFRGFGGHGGLQQDGGPPLLFNPSMNISETDKGLSITVELPGVSEKDVDVDLIDDVLTIRGEKKVESEQGGEKENFHHVERSYGSFQRSLRLPFSAQHDQVKARFDNGVLCITVPKPSNQQRSRKIQVEGSSAASAGAGAEGSGTAAGAGAGRQTSGGANGGSNDAEASAARAAAQGAD